MTIQCQKEIKNDSQAPKTIDIKRPSHTQCFLALYRTKQMNGLRNEAKK